MGPYSKTISQLSLMIIVNSRVYRATKYLAENQVVTGTRRRYKKRLPRKGSNIEIFFKIGKPNYQEREFIKKCKKAGEPFPVKKIQIKYDKTR